MEQIYDTRDKLLNFDFTKLVLSKPTLISGGNYFIRFKKNNIPLYIQPPCCNTRNGFIKNGRKYYTDLLFTNDDEYIIQWLEALEEHCIQYIYEHRNDLFDGDMEKADIENYFTSPLKIYKSGKFYSVRTNIPTALEKPIIKIYDEDENIVEFTSITEKTKLMNILEIQGIKCSARSFQIELEIKQALVIRPQELNLFDKCVIKSTERAPIPVMSTIETSESTNGELEVSNETNSILPSHTNHENESITSSISDDIKISINDNNIPIAENDDTTNNLGKFTEEDPIVDDIDKLLEDINEPILTDDISEIQIDIPENKNAMEEVEFTLDELSTDDKVILKQPNEVYYKMYRDARQKAKIAREMALSSYLEAKNIKNTYLLNDIVDSDTSDLDLDDESIISENESIQ